MAIHKLRLDELEELNYSIIAIHTSLEDYRLAFFLNRELRLHLSRCSKNIFINTKEGETFFSKYTFFDHKKDITWHLVQNKNELIPSYTNQKSNLFVDENISIATQVYLLPEIKKADYFLKIDDCSYDYTIANTIAQLNTIEAINAAYTIDIDVLKTKNNLIF